MARIWLFLVLQLLVALSGEVVAAAKASPSPMPVPAASNPLPAPDTRSDAGAYTGTSEYRIGPQDLLEISVFQVADLNRTVRVNTGGQISLPLIGAVQAGGKTVQELEHDIAGKLEAGFLQHPQVTVFIKEFTSQRVTLEGAVSRPGIYPLTGKTTLLQAIALGGGVTSLADLRGVVVFRMIGGRKLGARFNLKDIRAGRSEDPQVYGDDIIVVDESGSKSAWRRLVESIPVFNIFIP
jgi:polysaccharide export outer membrane protein